MGWKLIKGSETTIQAQLDALGAEEIKHFAASIDGGKFAVLAWDGKKAPIGEPQIVEKEVIKEVEKIVEVDNPKLLDKIVELKEQLKTCQDANKELTEASKKLEKENAALVKKNEKLTAALTE